MKRFVFFLFVGTMNKKQRPGYKGSITKKKLFIIQKKRKRKQKTNKKKL